MQTITDTVISVGLFENCLSFLKNLIFLNFDRNPDVVYLENLKRSGVLLFKPPWSEIFFFIIL